VVDEAVIAYQPSLASKIRAEKTGEPVPVVYIPRKPHPNGLEDFLLCTYVDNPAREQGVLPYIIDIRPHLQVGDSAPANIVQDFMKR